MECAIHRLVEEKLKIEPFERKLKNEETGKRAYDIIEKHPLIFLIEKSNECPMLYN